jgi:hypothetical protein
LSATAGGPVLLVAGGALEGRALPMRGESGEHVLGSAPTASLRLEAANVEAAHAWVTWDERGVFVNDAGTKSGTFVNGERVEQERELSDGDRISLGPPGNPASVKLLVHLPGHPSQYPPEEGQPVAARALAIAPDPPPAAPQPPQAEPQAPPTPARYEDAPAAGPSDEAKAAAESDKWGAVDDDDEVIKPAAVPAAPKPPPPPKPPPAPQPPPVAHATPHPHPAPQAHAPAAPAPRAVTQPLPRVQQPHRRAASRAATARPPLSRALLVGVAAALVAGLAFFGYLRSQAPAPVLVSLLPAKAETGQTIQINGSGFETKPEDNQVSFGDARAEVSSAREQQLAVVVPQLPTDGKSEHKVRVKARGSSSNTLHFQVYVGPKVASLEPDVAMPGDVVKAAGENFGEGTAIQVGGAAAEVIEAQPTALRFRVPKLPVVPGKSVPVAVQVGKNAARPIPLLIGKLPLLLEVSPERGLPGDRVSLKGRGFDPAPGGSQVTFGGRAALVVSASANELSVVVPGGGQLSGPSELPLSVRAGGSASTGGPAFRLARISRAEFVPRFSAEPGPDAETVYVSSDLGPFLRLRGKADAPSAAERGARAAAALNAAFEQAARAPLTIELRDKPEHAVTLAGAAAPLLVARPEDGAAYEGARPTPRALARYWGALLQDYLVLFVQKQRPLRVLELSPRGQALLELYVAAERRAGVGSGVPPSVVENLNSSQTRALAEMALQIPGEGQATTGAAVAGRWDGTLEEVGQPARAIQLRVRAGASLSGSLTRRSGGISGEVPLQEATYKDGVLRFVVKMGAAPLHFQGQVEGRSIAGQLQSADGKPRGSFSVRWVE